MIIQINRSRLPAVVAMMIRLKLQDIVLEVHEKEVYF